MNEQTYWKIYWTAVGLLVAGVGVGLTCYYAGSPEALGNIAVFQAGFIASLVRSGGLSRVRKD